MIQDILSVFRLPTILLSAVAGDAAAAVVMRRRRHA
jgi:hypothetical protein